MTIGRLLGPLIRGLSGTLLASVAVMTTAVQEAGTASLDVAGVAVEAMDAARYQGSAGGGIFHAAQR